VVENNLVFHGLVVLADHWVGSENVENVPAFLRGTTEVEKQLNLLEAQQF